MFFVAKCIDYIYFKVNNRVIEVLRPSCLFTFCWVIKSGLTAAFAGLCVSSSGSSFLYIPSAAFGQDQWCLSAAEC